MPIKPENKAKYPANWAEIRQQILERESHLCKWCGVADRAIGYRDASGNFQVCEATQSEALHLDGVKLIRIVLTIAHVHDMNPENCDPENLAALCQRCHNRHDIEHRRKTRAVSAEAKSLQAGQRAMFSEGGR